MDSAEHAVPTLGETLVHDRIIYLDKALTERPTKEWRRVLVHELVHAALGIGGLTEILDSKVEEAICLALESVFEHAIDFSEVR